MFILDSSGSIRDNNPKNDAGVDIGDNYALLLSFVADIVAKLNIGESQTRVGVVYYSGLAFSEFYLNNTNWNNKAAMMTQIRNIRYVIRIANEPAMHYDVF